MNKCTGCGVKIETNDLCERCFRIKHYNDYKLVSKNNNEFYEILDKVKTTNDLVVLVVDLFNLDRNLEDLTKRLNNNILLVLSKRDILPKKLYDQKLLDYFDNFNIKFIDKIIISSKKNYNFDLLYEKINNYKTSNNVYVIGYTNSGKSTMINKLIYNYTDLKQEITTSILPSTTLDTLEIKLNENLTIIDTPGILPEDNLINMVEGNILRKIIPQIEIKPETYQIKSKQIFIIDELLRVEAARDIIFYLSDKLEIKRYYKENDKLLNLEKHIIKAIRNEDIVISGLGFIKILQNTEIIIYTIPNVSVYKRKSLI